MEQITLSGFQAFRLSAESALQLIVKRRFLLDAIHALRSKIQFFFQTNRPLGLMGHPIGLMGCTSGLMEHSTGLMRHATERMDDSSGLMGHPIERMNHSSGRLDRPTGLMDRSPPPKNEEFSVFRHPHGWFSIQNSFKINKIQKSCQAL